MGLVACQSDIHRSFWLYANHPALFERACEFDYLERHGSQAQQHDLGVRRRPRLSDAALAALRQAISAFYQRELQCGDGSAAYVVERSPGVFLLTVHVKDLAMLRLEFEGANLTRRVGNPNIHMVLEYSARTGVARTLMRGGAKYHQMLVDAFAEHLLGVKVDAHRIKPPTLDLSVLRLGFDVPQAVADGFVALVDFPAQPGHDLEARLHRDGLQRTALRDRPSPRKTARPLDGKLAGHGGAHQPVLPA